MVPPNLVKPPCIGCTVGLQRAPRTLRLLALLCWVGEVLTTLQSWDFNQQDSESTRGTSV